MTPKVFRRVSDLILKIHMRERNDWTVSKGLYPPKSRMFRSITS